MALTLTLRLKSVSILCGTPPDTSGTSTAFCWCFGSALWSQSLTWPPQRILSDLSWPYCHCSLTHHMYTKQKPALFSRVENRFKAWEFISQSWCWWCGIWFSIKNGWGGSVRQGSRSVSHSSGCRCVCIHLFCSSALCPVWSCIHSQTTTKNLTPPARSPTYMLSLWRTCRCVLQATPKSPISISELIHLKEISNPKACSLDLLVIRNLSTLWHSLILPIIRISKIRGSSLANSSSSHQIYLNSMQEVFV